MEPKGVEPSTSCMPCKQPIDVNPCKSTPAVSSDEGCCTERCTEYPPAPDFNPDLAEVVTAWPTLPEAIRAGIVAMVKTQREG